MVSLMLQFSFYYFLNHQVEKVMSPDIGPIVIKNLEAEIPGTNLQNIQISYAKDYLAYKENGVLKVFNLKQNKVVFEKKPPAGNEKNLGVLYYQWLPDRDTLVYFYARKNPNPVTTIVVPVTPQTETNQGASNTNTQKAPTTTKPTTGTTPSNSSNTNTNTSPTQTPSNSNGTKIQSTENPTISNADPLTIATSTSKTQEVEKTEDPNQGTKNPSTQPGTSNSGKTQTRVETRYNNPQITELFTLELPPSDEVEIEPDDRINRSIDSFPAGGEITQMVASTFTNLMYLTIKNGTNHQLMEIDIMKNVRTLNRSGEIITQMAVSDKFGTLYVKSKIGKTEEIDALQGWEREIVTKDTNDIILGDRAGTIYLGKIQAGSLVNIRSASDTSDDKDLEFKTIWEGSIPYDNHKGVIIGAKNEVVIYNNKTAYIISNGKENEINLEGEENFISPDGVELIQLTRIGTSTKVKLQPLQ
jgi:hypothetical protein